MINKRLISFFILFATAASAGQKTNYEVSVTTNADNVTRAAGSIAGVQNSADGTQSIGCWVSWDGLDGDGPGYRILWCHATSAVGVYALCVVPNPAQALVDMVLNMQDSSYLTFQYKTSSTSTPRCKYVQVYRNSLQVPQSGIATVTTVKPLTPELTIPPADQRH